MIKKSDCPTLWPDIALTYTILIHMKHTSFMTEFKEIDNCR